MYFIIVILKHPILWSAFMKNGVNISYIIIIKYPNKKAKHCIVDKKQISKSIIDDCDQGHHDSRNIGVNSKPLLLNQWREATRTDKRWFKFKLSHSKSVNFEKVHQTFHRRCRDLNDLYQWNSKKVWTWMDYWTFATKIFRARSDNLFSWFSSFLHYLSWINSTRTSQFVV